MERFRRQFGKHVAETLMRCPTALADLEQIRAKGVKIRRFSGPRLSAYSMPKRRSIYISKRASCAFVLISLAHEKVHVLDRVTLDPIAGITGRQEFINECLECETDAVVHEVQVTGELLKIKHRNIPPHLLANYELFERGGRAAIREHFEQMVTSTTGETYPEYYGLWYDDVVKPELRLP